MNTYREKLHRAVNLMDDFQLRLVWGFVNRLFHSEPEQANVVDIRKEKAA